MIDIDKAQKVITDSVTCTLPKSEINREGSYLIFSDVVIENHFNINYNFSLRVAIGSFTKDEKQIYTELNKRLNEINNVSEIELMSCKPKWESKLLIYDLKLKVKIIG